MARMLGGRARVRGGALLDRDAPVDAVFLGWIVARRLVVRAAVVPDDDVALAPLVAVLPRRLGPLTGPLRHPTLALPPPHPPRAPDVCPVEGEGPAAPPPARRR